jgi:hypothetical protein
MDNPWFEFGLPGNCSLTIPDIVIDERAWRALASRIDRVSEWEFCVGLCANARIDLRRIAIYARGCAGRSDSTG